MKENTIKGVLSIVFAGIAVYFRNLIGPLIVLAVVMLIDYVTGMTQAWISATLSSRAGILGLIKKIGYLFAVAVAVVVQVIGALQSDDYGLSISEYFDQVADILQVATGETGGLNTEEGFDLRRLDTSEELLHPRAVRYSLT